MALVVFHRVDESTLNKGLAVVGARARVIVSAPSQGWVTLADPRIYFVVGPEISPPDLTDLIASALMGPPAGDPVPESIDDAKLHKAVLDAAGRFASSEDPATATAAVCAALLELLRADRVHCLLHDAHAGALWALGPHAREGWANEGISGFVARTGRGVWATRADADPRYCRALDDPGGDGREQLLVAPIRGAGGDVHAVIVVARAAHRHGFDPRERGTLGLFVARAGPMMDHLARREEVALVVREHETRSEGPFRAEALRERRKVARGGDVVRVNGAWVVWTHRLVVALVVSALAYLVLGRVNIYSAGPAVVRLQARSEVTASASGPLSELAVTPGQVVQPGDLLARLDDRQARDELTRVEASWRSQLRARLLDPQDQATAASVVALRRQRRDARAALAEREIRAPVGGVVSDLRIRSGQHIGVGEIVMSLVRADDAQRVVALMPGADSPRIEPGMAMRIELPGYPRAYQRVTISRVSDEVVGPSEVQRFLGPALADSLTIAGPMVLVEATLASPEFVVDGRSYRFHDGMQARAEVRVDSRSLLEMLIPGLQGALTRG
ncbi:putative Co/Zn/Cd efflux system membrane fusion protein [Enhygromyxa salina]|uniref:Putative Co/Zn/Cd efflux system membrane fusion protein n=1 Tax=Enhygromyxa salina TaxID=215803 RepID=A0A0C1ZLX7_9BACT|nr:HlyD family efflux transporter periplasmic adaptor subunit [Enhygromyxa salina]KIG18514.1 putative Co/Zn/Cd efflux system membrane fusion protein [Enhygromyxa salina]